MLRSLVRRVMIWKVVRQVFDTLVSSRMRFLNNHLASMNIAWKGSDIFAGYCDAEYRNRPKYVDPKMFSEFIKLLKSEETVKLSK